MIKTLRLACLATALFAAVPGFAGDLQSTKQEAVAAIDAHSTELVGLADQVWAFAEVGLHETRSVAVLADYAETQGFTVERGVAGMPTAFIASYGSGRPIIGILGEYDALPGISQRAQSTQEPLVPGAAGHGCGHNLLGTASLGAALAVKELIAAGELGGTVRYYGTPAEETVGGKLYMVRAGLFDDVDAVLAWHPDVEVRADTQPNQAVVDFIVEFEGRAAHAAYDPWNGRSAADGAEVFTFAINLMREHVKPTVRMHYVVTDAGDVPNVVPTYARVWCWLRDVNATGVNQLLERARKIAEGAALVDRHYRPPHRAVGELGAVAQHGRRKAHPRQHGVAGGDRLHPRGAGVRTRDPARHRRRAGRSQRRAGAARSRPDRDPGRIDGCRRRQLAGADPPPVGDHRARRRAVARLAGGGLRRHVHRPQGHDLRRRRSATTMVDLYSDPAKLAAVRREFDEKTRGVEYVSYLPDGPPPLPAD